MKNKIIVNLWLESGCDPKEEVSVSWSPINFAIYSTLFPEMIDEAVQTWISTNTVHYELQIEIIFQHIIERDVGGAVMHEYFEPIHEERGG